MPNTNTWCDALGIDVPDLEATCDHREANTYARLIVALLERGEPMTLAQVATRFEDVGIAPYARSLLSLQRCKPARAPVYRDGDTYALDPHDRELSLWAFRLDLEPPRAPALRVVEPEPEPLPGPDVPVTPDELDIAWKEARLYSWSAQRLILAVLEAHGGPMEPADVVAKVYARTDHHPLRHDAQGLTARTSPVHVGPDGRWSIAASAGPKLTAMRKAVRAEVEKERQRAASLPSPEVSEAYRKAYQRRREARAAQLAALKRAVLVGFPAANPRAVSLVDVSTRTVETWFQDGFDDLRARLATFDLIGAIGVRTLLRALDFDPGERRLAELGPPQKTKQINKRGRTLKITPAILVQGTCGITRPFGDPKKLATYLDRDDRTRLRRRLESDARSLFALYQYSLLHGCVRLRWGFLDEPLPAPWADPAEDRIYELKQGAWDDSRALVVVLGNAPAWDEPWARSITVYPWKDDLGLLRLMDEDGYSVPEPDIQLARLGPPI